MAGEVELAWDVKRSHPVPPVLTDLINFLAIRLSVHIRRTGTLNNRFKNQLPAYDPEDFAA